MSGASRDWQADLERAASSTYSAGGEDGVLLRLFERIGTTNRYFVEFGAWDGRHESNTALLRLHHGWQGLLMEGSDRADGALVRREFVTPENVEALFHRYRVPSRFDLLSIDIDGNDYWVWKAIRGFTPRVVVVEYNIHFATHLARTMPYDPDHEWDETLYHGASLAALRKLGHEKGYALVHAEGWAPNAFFVHRDALPAGFVERPIEAVTPWNRFAETPAVGGRPWQAV